MIVNITTSLVAVSSNRRKWPQRSKYGLMILAIKGGRKTRRIKISIIANKRFEADALVGVLTNRDARPKRIIQPQKICSPPDTSTSDYTPLQSPHVIIDIVSSDSSLDDLVATLAVWCIEDMMISDSHKSSTEDKWPVLEEQILAEQTDLVIAFGTAAYPSHVSHNGCVSMGLKTFTHNPQTYPNGETPTSKWSHARTEEIVTSTLDPEVFNSISPQTILAVMKRLLPPPMNPACDLVIHHSPDLLSVGVVNITDCRHYSWTDYKTIERARETGFNGIIGSMETTHGVIHLASDFPFLYISGIANRVGFFDIEVSPMPYAQNFVASHNAAIAATWMVPEIVDYLDNR